MAQLEVTYRETRVYRKRIDVHDASQYETLQTLSEHDDPDEANDWTYDIVDRSLELSDAGN